MGRDDVHEVNPKSWTKNFWENDKVSRFKDKVTGDKFAKKRHGGHVNRKDAERECQPDKQMAESI